MLYPNLKAHDDEIHGMIINELARRRRGFAR